jgi:transposase
MPMTLDYPKRDYGNARREYAYQLYRRGFNFREIGERLGVSQAQAGNIVHAYENDPDVCGDT